MRKLSFKTFDVFTTQRFHGNGLAVVQDADGLSDEAMQAIAREFNLSETVFLLEPGNKAYSARMRIFTPHNELPFAGHPVVGAAAMLGEARLGEINTEEDAIVVLEAEIGAIRVGVRVGPNKPPFAEFDLPKLPEELPDAPTSEELSMILGLTSSELGFENHKPSCFGAGLAFIFAPVQNLAAIGKININTDAMKRLLAKERRQLFVYCREAIRADSAYHARMFAPFLGVPEDPATGSAAAAFAGVIMKFDQPAGGTKNYVIEQGVEMGRPSKIHLELAVDGDLRAARIGGSVVQVSKGEIWV